MKPVVAHVCLLSLCFAWPAPASAQTPPAPPTPTTVAAASSTPPAVRVGGTLFTDYTHTFTPKVADATGHLISPDAFNITRAYLIVAGNVSKRVSFRVTTDISRETGTGSSLNGSLTLRIKHGYLQVGLDPWLGPRSWVRFGLQSMPQVDYVETIYRYRFQGQPSAERDIDLSSADAGATVHVELPHGYGEVHGGVYNGEGFSHVDANGQKALEARFTLRPAPKDPALKGLRLDFYVDHDHYAGDTARERRIAGAIYEHRRFNTGAELIMASDQSLSTSRKVNLRGVSAWVTPFFKTKGSGPEALLRFDHIVMDRELGTTRNRLITGVAYWFPHDGATASALLFDFEQLITTATPAVPTLRKLSVHALVSFSGDKNTEVLG